MGVGDEGFYHRRNCRAGGLGRDERTKEREAQGQDAKKAYAGLRQRADWVIRHDVKERLASGKSSKVMNAYIRRKDGMKVTSACVGDVSEMFGPLFISKASKHSGFRMLSRLCVS
jgi:hypothetical protein